MKKYFILLLLCIFLTSCMPFIPFFTGYPSTKFFVKNNSDVVVSFKTTVVKFSSLTGPYEMTVPFNVHPKDSVLARQVGFKKNGNPSKWFISFVIHPVNGVKLNDPYQAENWKKKFDKNGKTYYTFIIAE